MTMAWGKEKQAQQEHAVGLNDLRLMIADRLQVAQRRCDPASASAAFARANDNGQDNLIGSLLLGMLCFAPVMAAFNGSAAATAAVGAAHTPWTSLIEGISMVWDEKAIKNRRLRRAFNVFKDGIYHGGRRQEGTLSQKEMAAKFNMVSANENAAFSVDAAAEVAALNDMLDSIDALERKGVRMLSLDETKAVSTNLREASAVSTPKTMNRKSAALRIAV